MAGFYSIGFFPLLFAVTVCVPLTEFYPFGFDQGDLQLSALQSSGSAVSSKVYLPEPLVFFGLGKKSAYVSKESS